MKSIYSSFLLGALVSAGLMASPTAQVSLLNAGNPGLVDANNNYVGPYTLSINGLPTSALCVDDKDWSSLNSTWTANVTQLSGNDLSSTYNPTSETEYKEAAVLYNLLAKPGADRIDIQHAAWDIMDYSITNQSELTVLHGMGSISASDGANTYIGDAISGYGAASMAGFEIISSANGPKEQEFIVCDPAPEPTTYALLGLGLVVLGGSRALIGKRKGVKQQTQTTLVRRPQQTA